MATLGARWLLPILLCSLQNYFAKAGSPAPLSVPECFIPCDEKTCQVDIECTWDSSWDPQIPTNYSLHWKTANSEKGHVTIETIGHGSIHREHFSSHEQLNVWVEAKTQHGSAKSQEVSFNTADINKPPPPYITLSHEEPLEIEWSIESSSICDQLQLSAGSCEVQNRTEANQVWLQHESGILYSYTLDNPQLCTVHEFRVRCNCGRTKTSDWSEIFRVWAETDPVGELDIWRDCGFSPAGFDCVVTWKKLPKSKACGLILRYEVGLSYNDGTSMLVNVSTDGRSSQLVCDGIKCYLNSSLKAVSSVNVTAYNSHGATVPAYLAMPVQGKEKDEQSIDVKMNEENLIVSWNLTPQLSDNLDKIVVQYKQAGCPPGQGFDWIKVNKNQTTGFLKGQFHISTPYNVSLFTVSHSGRIHHFSSLIGYSLEGTPPRVPSFTVLSIAAHQVTLFWEPIPLSKQNGVIRCYQIGVDGQNVRNVSPSSQNEYYSFDLKPLSPGQEYKVWIRAVTLAGPGENVTANFKTKQNENDDNLKILFVIPVVCCLSVICFVTVVFWLCRGENKGCLLVPDPRNSHIFTNMKHQINDPSPLLCKPPLEPHPKIVVLEIVEMQPGALKSPPKKTANLTGLNMSIVGDGCPQMDQKEDLVTVDCDRLNHRYEREEYSKMVDSDEEKDRETEDRDDCSNSSEEEQFISGYEKHFMPTAVDIQTVS